MNQNQNRPNTIPLTPNNQYPDVFKNAKEWFEDADQFDEQKHLFYPIAGDQLKTMFVIVNDLDSSLDKNVNQLKTFFKDDLRFDITEYKLETNGLTLDEVLRIESKKNYSNYDCYMMLVLTDSQKGKSTLKVLESQQNVKKSDFKLTNIFEPFTAKESSLQGKPKIFMLQCHNEEELRTIASGSSVEHDGVISTLIYRIKSLLGCNYSVLPTYANFLLFYSPFKLDNFCTKLSKNLSQWSSTDSDDLVSALTRCCNELRAEQIETFNKNRKTNSSLAKPANRHIPYLSSTLIRLIAFRRQQSSIFRPQNFINYYTRKDSTQGKCVIINIENYQYDNFSTNEDKWRRAGTKQNGLLLAETFHKCGFTVRHYFDKNRYESDHKSVSEFDVQTDTRLTRDEILRIVQEELMDENIGAKHFVLWILTHGTHNGVLYAYDTTIGTQGQNHVLEKELYVNEILDLLADDRAGSWAKLRGVPKCVFIEACKGEAVDGGRKVFHDGEAAGDDQICCLPNDTLICYTTYPDHLSFRSWFLASFCAILQSDFDRNDSAQYDLMTLITVAFQYIALRKRSRTLPEKPELHDKKLIPFVNSTLTQMVGFGHFEDDIEDDDDDDDYYQDDNYDNDNQDDDSDDDDNDLSKSDRKCLFK